MSRLIAAWIGFDVLLFASGVVLIALSRLWTTKDILLNLVFPPLYLNAALALGSLYLLTTFLSIPAVLQPPSRTSFLAWLNTALFINFICTMILSSKLWFFSLRQVVNFEEIFRSLDEAARGRLETKLECCGYYNGTTSGLYTHSSSSTYCSDPLTLASSDGCSQPILVYSERALGPAFTCLYGFVAIIMCFLIATACLIEERKLIVRYLKIDAKRGGRGGFV